MKEMIHKAQRVFQGFKDWGSLSTVWLLKSFIFSFAALLWFTVFFFFIALLEHTHFILDVSFSSNLGMPPSIWVSWALYAFLAFSQPFLFSHWNFLLPLSVGCDPSWDFFHERKIILAQKGIARDVLILERERNNKDGLSSFQTQATMINKLWPRQVWWFDLCKDAFHGSWATSSLHTIIHTFKNTWFKSRGVRVFIHFFFYNLVTSMIELLDSLVILQVEC